MAGSNLLDANKTTSRTAQEGSKRNMFCFLASNQDHPTSSAVAFTTSGEAPNRELNGIIQTQIRVVNPDLIGVNPSFKSVTIIPWKKFMMLS